MNDPVTILFAEDERLVRASISGVLSRAGYSVRLARNGSEAVSDFQLRRSDIVLLDVMMPRMSGREACEAIRQIDCDVPILFLTALDGERDEVAGLAAGADDYVPKTASDEVLLAHIASAVRRIRPIASGCFVFGSGRVDALASQFIECSSVRKTSLPPVRLSVREVELLRLFTENPNAVLTKDFLQTRIFGVDYAGDLRSFDKTIERLRAKLGASSAYLHTVPRQGLQYVPPC